MSEPTQREELATIIESHTMSTSDVTCCSCGAWFNEETNGAIDIQHRDHIADALTPFIERAKAEALRDAAALIGTHGYLLRWADVVADHTTADWLRDYADAIEKGV